VDTKERDVLQSTIAILIGVFLSATQATPQTPGAQDWRVFRERHPFHLQTIALGSPDAAGARTLIVSEPPPHVTPGGLAAIDPVLKTPAIHSHRIGTDGWVKDLVYRLPPLDRSTLNQLIDQLSVALFHTSYKAYALPIAARGVSPATSLNLRVTAEQLRGWLSAERERFRGLGSADALPLSQLLADGRSGVFYDAEPGLVAWVVPRGQDLAVFKRQARQFALDTDVMLGALAGKSHVAIVARERQAPVDVMPPLRTETIMLLASVKDSELAQSYERNLFGAGKLKDDNDWAPIYLSDELIDTEYGSLLNITDQLLKSWTNAGRVRYAFFSYPDRGKWPFAKPLGELLASTSLTYNWNTTGVGYELDSGGARTFALNRTGALPVSYFPEGSAAKIQGYEETAYEYFASAGDANLARVVQYLAVYQAFLRYGVHATAAQTPVSSHPEREALVNAARATLVRFDKGSAATLLDEFVARRGGGTLQTDVADSFRQLQTDLRKYRSSSGDADFTRLARQMADPRRDERRPATESQTAAQRSQARLVVELAARLDRYGALLVAPDDTLAAYRRAAAREPGGWIKTPSFVVSTSRLPDRLVGGHNLSARVTRVAEDLQVPRGRVVVRTGEGGERVVAVNPADVAPTVRAVRTAAKEEPAAVQQALERALTAPRPAAVPRRIALGLGPMATQTARANRGLHARMMPTGTQRSGWHPASDAPPPGSFAKASDASAGPAIFIERQPDATYLVVGDNVTPHLVARSYDSAVDAVAEAVSTASGRRAMTLHLTDVPRRDATNFLRSVEVRSSAVRREKLAVVTRPKRMTARQTRSALDADYNFKAAKIREMQVESVAEGQNLKVLVEVPAVVVTKPSLFVRIQLLFKTKVADPIKRQVEALITKAFGQVRVMTTEADVIPTSAILRQIKEDLRKMYPDLDVELSISQAGGDIYVAEVRLAVAPRPA
jgi:hypothetical protein